MNSPEQIADLIVKQGMLPLYFNADETVSIEVLRALYKAGIKQLNTLIVAMQH
jgi:2-dehydro-3-deoxyphosphogluconate aldolase/(4S)-4-hydroxy-2-oxoglutarate aldolase